MTKQQALEWFECRAESITLSDKCAEAENVAMLCIAESINLDNPRGIWPDNGAWVCGCCRAVLAFDKPKPWKFCPWCGERVMMFADDEEVP